MPDATAEDFDLGRSALLEITPAETVGANAGSIEEGDGVVSVHFETTLGGYPGWHWTVSIAHVDGVAPSVLETELTPGEGALLAPDWIPWVDRLADYRAAQEAAGIAAEELEAATRESDDDDEDDDDDDDELDNDVLHGGDLDGVDIDVVDDDDDESEDADDDESDGDESDDADDDESGDESDDADDDLSDSDEPDADGSALPVTGVEDSDEAER
jgi:hypothetical protein